MNTRVYVETSFISYLAARPSRDPTKAARQLQAQALWRAGDRFSLVISPAVIDEASRGDPTQAIRAATNTGRLAGAIDKRRSGLSGPIAAPA